MERVIVTVKHTQEAQSRDLEVPAEIEASRLAGLIAAALRWGGDETGRSVRYEIWAEPPGRTLSPHESLADASAWDGARLVLQPIGGRMAGPIPPSGTVTAPSSIAKGPVESWKPLGIDLPGPAISGQPVAPEQDKSQSGFVWKRLD